jgi:hypothetical protein
MTKELSDQFWFLCSYPLAHTSESTEELYVLRVMQSSKNTQLFPQTKLSLNIRILDSQISVLPLGPNTVNGIVEHDFFIVGIP